MTAVSARKGLSPKTIQTLVDAGQPGLWAHRHGLSLSISKAGSANWTLRYTAPTGQRRLMTLEPVINVGAATIKALEARALMMKQQVRAGIDPLAERDSGRKTVETARKRINTFEEAAKRFIAEQSPNWKNAVHRTQWSSTLETYAYPIIGKKEPHEITTQDILNVLRQKYKETSLWDGARETASRVRMRIETVLNAEFALNRDNPLQKEAWQDFRNPAQWKNHLQVVFKASGRRSKSHFEAMSFDDIPAFFTTLLRKSDYSAKALTLTILSATRTNETLGAKWDEFDLSSGVWTIPAERMKAGREHRVPLCGVAIEMLETLPRIDDNPYVFPGAREKKPLSNMAMLMLLRGMRESEQLTVHGFRSTFRDWAAETTLHPDTIVEMALAHTIKDKTVAAYRRGDAFERRKQLMRQWSDYLSMTDKKYKEEWFKFIA
ncbi:tyrosine-type recombinase/integrase [Agrobacterium genomosp. 3 str. CIP 111-78]|uniref:DUF4102 domain-containing protein n=2 Tax=Agrobacterium tumefaciens TaxID=358 RepID=A0AAE6BMC7_AGRTU|nr:site-specific integrase [Agrobacterium tomkonis]MCA2370707.1 tyrosine-type recombinase/integrase [Agrobacterium tomkonis CIP 111-78]QCM01104.1 DUF4102 domain-containing protein [Agrobacterium tumefaciens]